MNTSKSSVTWKDVKTSLTGHTERELLHLIRDLYQFSKENKHFLHARFLDLECGVAPYRQVVKEAVYPHPLANGRPNKNPDIRQAERAIQQYKKASPEPAAGTIELNLTFIEWGLRFTVMYGDHEEAFFSHLIPMTNEVLGILRNNNQEVIDHYFPWLMTIKQLAVNIGWDVYFLHLQRILAHVFPDKFQQT